MNNKHYIGRAVNSLEHYDKVGPITGVSILVDENNEYVAGDMTGYVFETTCPYGTQAMANAMLASLQGKVYKGFRATDAILDKDAELGDGITIDGEYAMLAYQEITFGPKHTSEIAAPGESILEHEYPYVGSTQKTINRRIAQVNSRITKTAEEIRLEVEKELNGLSSSISVKVDSITSKVESSVPYSSSMDPSKNWTDEEKTGNIGYLWYDTSNDVLKKWNGTLWVNSPTDSWAGAMSMIKQTVDSLTLSVSNGETSSTIKLMAGTTQISSQTIKFTGDVVFSNDLTDGVTKISGNNIQSGKISAEYLKLGGTMKVYSSLTDTSAAGSLGYVTGRISGSLFTGIGMVATQDTAVVASALDDVLILSVNDTGIFAGNNIDLHASSHVRIDSDYLIPLADENTYCGSYSYWWYNGYFKTLNVNGSAITSSDRRLKENIDYDISKWLTMFDLLKPCSYKFIEGKRTHVGMIAQEVIEAGETAGLDMEHLTAVCLDEEGQMYGLRYEEFVPILIAKVQQLEKRLEELSA